jgi:hypothetical protein
MTKLKPGPLDDDKPVKISIELPAAVHRDLVAYARVLGRTTSQTAPDPSKLIVPMIQRFMASDRAFAKARHDRKRSGRAQLDREIGIVFAQQSHERSQSRVAIRFLPTPGRLSGEIIAPVAGSGR